MLCLKKRWYHGCQVVLYDAVDNEDFDDLSKTAGLF